ncbi:hypothetical protein R6Q57_015763 [Mikania cordata]
MARSSTGGGKGRGRDSGHNSCGTHTIGQLHSKTYEAPSQHESSDDDESTVGRRGLVAPTPLLEPRNREWIWIRHDQPCGLINGKVGKMSLMKMAIGCLDDLKFARESAKAAASKACVEVGNDLSVIIPYKPRWMRTEFWEPLVQSWNTPYWKAKSSQNIANRAKSTGGKHTLGSQTYVTLKIKAEEKHGRPATIDEIWMQSHGKKETRPLDRESHQKYVNEKYGDDTSKHPLFDLDTWVQLGKKKGTLFDISDPHVMTGAQSNSSTSLYLPARNEEVQQLNEKIARLQQEKETERLEKEKEKAEKLIMREQIEENRVANDAMKEANAEMRKQIEFLLKNITKN